MEGKNNDEPVVIFKYNEGKKCKLNMVEYSVEGQDILRKMLYLKD